VDDRQQQLNAWLCKALPDGDFKLTTASADASFRRYFRVHLETPHLGYSTLIAMDAPPPQEDCTPFVKIAKQFLDAGLNVPKVIMQDLVNGFLLLSDLGNDTYLQHLNNETAQMLYGDATNALIKLQLASKSHDLPC
jgi:aminoglycoside/choline kinase family phosphotransferase